jgi:hypothetical protein
MIKNPSGQPEIAFNGLTMKAHNDDERVKDTIYHDNNNNNENNISISPIIISLNTFSINRQDH